MELTPNPEGVPETSSNTGHQEMSDEQVHILKSWSSGGLIPLLYSASMKIWPIFWLEVSFSLVALLGTVAFVLFAANPTEWLGIGLVLIPALSLLLLVGKIVFSKRMAWKFRGWVSFDQFLLVQKKWDVIGRSLLLLCVIPLLGSFFLGGLNGIFSSFGPRAQSITGPTPDPSLVSTRVTLKDKNTFSSFPAGGIKQLALKYVGSSNGEEKFVIRDLVDMSCKERTLSLPNDNVYVCGGASYMLTLDNSTIGNAAIGFRIVGGPVRHN